MASAFTVPSASRARRASGGRRAWPPGPWPQRARRGAGAPLTAPASPERLLACAHARPERRKNAFARPGYRTRTGLQQKPRAPNRPFWILVTPPRAGPATHSCPDAAWQEAPGSQPAGRGCPGGLAWPHCGTGARVPSRSPGPEPLHRAPVGRDHGLTPEASG